MDSDSDSSGNAPLASEEFAQRVEAWQQAAARLRTAARAPAAPESSSSDSEHGISSRPDSEHNSLGSDDDAIDAGAEDDEEVPGLDSQLVQALAAAAEARRQGGEVFLARLEEIAQDASDDDSVVDLAHLGEPQQEEEEEEELEGEVELEPDRAVVDAQHNLYENAANAASAPTVPFLDMDFGSGDDEDDESWPATAAERTFQWRVNAGPPLPLRAASSRRTPAPAPAAASDSAFASLLAPGGNDSLAATPGCPSALLHPDEGRLNAGFTELWRSLDADDARDAGLAFGRLLASRGLIKGQRDVEKQIRSILADVGQVDNWQNQELLAALRRRIFRVFSFSGTQIERFARGVLLMLSDPRKYARVLSPVLVDVVGAVAGDILQLVTFKDGSVVPGARLAAVQEACPFFGLQHALLAFIYGYFLNKCEGGVGEVVETSKLDGPPYDQGYGPPVGVKRVGPSVELDENVACQECYYGNRTKKNFFFCAYTGEGCDDGLRVFIDFMTHLELVVSVRTSKAICELMVRSAAAVADEAADTMVLRCDSDGDAVLLGADLEAVADDGGAPRARVDMRRRAVVRDVVSTRFALRLFAPRGAASRAALDDNEDQAPPPTARGALDDDDDDAENDLKYAQYSYDSLERESQSLVEYQHEAKQCLAWARDRLQVLDVYSRLRTLPPGGRCFFAFRSSLIPGKPTKLLEVTNWDNSITSRRVTDPNCLEDLRGSEVWRLLCVANWLADHCLGVVPADGELFASEPEPHELESLYMDYRGILGTGICETISLIRGMNFAAFYTDIACHLCLCSIRDVALWNFGGVSVELGMNVRRLGPVSSLDDIPWAEKPLDVASVRATLGVADLVRHADCHRLERAVRVADWLESSTDDVLLEWACSEGHVNEVRSGLLRSRAECRDALSFFTCKFCRRMHRNHRPDDQGNCGLHRIFVRPKAESGGADGAGDSSRSMDVGD